MQSRVHLSRSKLHRPRLAADLIQRKRLLEWFETNQTKPVILLAAPVGFGKTSLLGTWSENAPFPCAWLSLDADDNELHRFTRYLIAAVRTVFPGSLTSTHDLVNTPERAELARLTTTLLNELEELPSDFYLLLDNYHTLRDNAIGALMSQLVRHLPAQVRLIISTRTDSPLPLSRLRADGNLGELRSSDLRFTLQETGEFFRHTILATLSAEAVQLLYERTEGWAVGLRFASLLFREGSDPQEVVSRLTSSRKYQLMDYMLNEILTQHSAPVRQLILRTCLLDRFTSDLCRAVSVDGDGERCRAILEELVQDETLVELRDDKNVWFRYQTLFSEFLRAQAQSFFDTATVLKVYRDASAWCELRGYIAEAIEYALKAGDPTTATSLVGEHLHPTLNQEAGRTIIAKWLALFPPEMLDRDLDLVRAQLWLAGLQFRTPALSELIDTANRLLAGATHLDRAQRRAVQSEIANGLATQAQWSNDGATAVQIAAEFYDAIPATHEYARGSMLMELALGHQMLGNTGSALHVLTDALRKDHSTSSEFTVRVLIGFATVHLNNADFENVARVSERLLQLVNENSHVSLASAHYLLGLVNYEWNKLEAAAHHFTVASELRYLGNVKPGHESLARLALTQQARGLTDAANRTREKLGIYTREIGSGAFVYDESSYSARLALAQGHVDAALEWVSSVGVAPRPHMIYEVEANLTRLMTLLQTRQPEHLRTVLDETSALLELAQFLHNKRRIIQLYAIKALAEQALGKRAAALESLEASVSLAEPGGFVRTYLDLGPEMQGLLNRLVVRSKATSHIKHILAADSVGGLSRPSTATTGRQAGARLVESLTLRERQVLEHLALRLSDKEIARALVISPLTVKAHTDHIYQKLGVNNRQAAVKVGVEVGLLDKTAIQYKMV